MMEWTDIALHKCKIERAHIFESLKPLNIMHVFMFRTVKLYFTGGVSDLKGFGQPCMVHTLQVINAVRSRNN